MYSTINGIELTNDKPIIYYKKRKKEIDPCIVFLFVFWILKEKSQSSIYSFVFIYYLIIFWSYALFIFAIKLDSQSSQSFYRKPAIMQKSTLIYQFLIDTKFIYG